MDHRCGWKCLVIQTDVGNKGKLEFVEVIQTERRPFGWRVRMREPSIFTILLLAGLSQAISVAER